MPDIEQQVFSVAEFCARNRLTLPTFHKLQKAGRGPRLMRFGHIARVSIEAEREWRAAMEADANSEKAQIEHKRRQKILSAMGKRSGQSPNHVSKTRVRR